MSIGNNIRNIRKEKKMTLQQIADIMGCSPQLISQYENGKRMPKLETLQRIAESLNVSLLQIVDADQLSKDIFMQEIKKEVLQLNLEELNELIELIKDSEKPRDKQSLIKIYDNMTDSAREKLLTYAEDLWFNPRTHRQIKE